MKAKSKYQACSVIVVSFWGLSACSHQTNADVAAASMVQPSPVVATPSVIVSPPTTVVQVMPVAQPYRDIVVAPAPLRPVKRPVIHNVPVIRPIPVAVATPAVPKIRAKGAYLGAIPVAGGLRQRYQKQK